MFARSAKLSFHSCYPNKVTVFGHAFPVSFCLDRIHSGLGSGAWRSPPIRSHHPSPCLVTQPVCSMIIRVLFKVGLNDIQFKIFDTTMLCQILCVCVCVCYSGEPFPPFKTSVMCLLGLHRLITRTSESFQPQTLQPIS